MTTCGTKPHLRAAAFVEFGYSAEIRVAPFKREKFFYLFRLSEYEFDVYHVFVLFGIVFTQIILPHSAPNYNSFDGIFI